MCFLYLFKKDNYDACTKVNISIFSVITFMLLRRRVQFKFSVNYFILFFCVSKTNSLVIKIDKNIFCREFVLILSGIVYFFLLVVFTDILIKNSLFVPSTTTFSKPRWKSGKLFWNKLLCFHNLLLVNWTRTASYACATRVCVSTGILQF